MSERFKKIMFSFRILEQVKQELEVIARNNQRTLSQQINFILSEWLRQHRGE